MALATDAGYLGNGLNLVNGGGDVSRSHVFKTVFPNEQGYAGEKTNATDRVISASKINPVDLTLQGRAAFEGNIEAVRKQLGSDDGGPPHCDMEED